MEFGWLTLWNDGWVLAILRGAMMTIAIGIASMAFGLVVGTVCGLIKWRRVTGLAQVVDVYTSVIRGVPELLIIYLLFFGSVEFVTRIGVVFGFGKIPDTLYAFVVTVFAIGSISGAYSTEVVRGALAAIPKGHIEAAVALGLPASRIFRRIIAPQMLRIALPGINNVWQTTIKDTALVSVVGLQELMRTAYIGAGSTHHPFFFYATAAMAYLLITFVSQTGFGWLERLLSATKAKVA
jgi:octopine/nopaline transport system permease protein